MKRVLLFIAASAIVLNATACASASSRELRVVVLNDQQTPQRVRLEIDGETVIYAVAAQMAVEPPVALSVTLHLPAGRHTADATNFVDAAPNARSAKTTFDLAQTRSTLVILLRGNGVEIRFVAYEALFL